MEIFTAPSNVMIERLDTNYYRPEYVDNDLMIENIGAVSFGQSLR